LVVRFPLSLLFFIFFTLLSFFLFFLSSAMRLIAVVIAALLISGVVCRDDALEKLEAFEDQVRRVENLLNALGDPACGYQSTDISSLMSTTDYPASDSSYQYKFNPCNKANEATCNSKGGSLCQYTSTVRFRFFFFWLWRP
jgi:hypothetical protein